MNNEERHMLVVPEKQSKINKIEQQYLEMKNDPTKAKIKTLEATEKALKMASTVAGIITVIDWLVPDPVLGIDEIALTSLTTLLGTAVTIVDNKKTRLEATGKSDISMEEIQMLSRQIQDARAKISSSRANVKK